MYKINFLDQKVKIINFFNKITSDTYETYVFDVIFCILRILKIS